MIRLLCIILMSVMLCFHAAVSAGQTQQLAITHADFAEPLVFNVALPDGYDQQTTKRYPLLFDFHPYANVYLTGMHDWMSHNGEWPWLKSIIVTPAQGNPVGTLFDSSGKTTPLLDFFEQHLLVEVDKQYRTNGFRIMSGFRYNGSIVLSALLRKPTMFNAYFAASPELKDDFVGLLSSAKEALKALDEKPRFLLYSHAATVKDAHQQSLYGQFSQMLHANAPHSLEWHEKDFGDHYHMSIPLLATINGIELLFDDMHNGLAPDSKIAQQGVDAIVAHYQHLSANKYGFEVSPKPSIQRLGKHLLAHAPQKGLAALKRLIGLYPDDAYSYHTVAEAHAQLGEFEQAVAMQSKAVELGASRSTWHQKKFQAALERYQAGLTED